MTHELIISGFGGNGVMSIGRLLAHAGVMEGKEVTWMPSYGPEQRGGTANVTVIISDAKISSPILSTYDIVIVLNQPSLDKFQNRVKPGGTLIYDSGAVSNPPSRKDIHIYRIPAMEKAADMKMEKGLGSFIIGGLLKVHPIVSQESIIASLREVLPERHHNLIPKNEEALQVGMHIVESLD